MGVVERGLSGGYMNVNIEKRRVGRLESSVESTEEREQLQEWE